MLQPRRSACSAETLILIVCSFNFLDMLWRHPLTRRPLPSCVSIGTQANSRITPSQKARFLSKTAMPHSVHSTRESTPIDEEQLALKYWNYNIPRRDWTVECPQFLVETSEKNKHVLSARDEDFKKFTWTEVQRLIGKQNAAAVRLSCRKHTDLG